MMIGLVAAKPVIMSVWPAAGAGTVYLVPSTNSTTRPLIDLIVPVISPATAAAAKPITAIARPKATVRFMPIFSRCLRASRPEASFALIKTGRNLGFTPPRGEHTRAGWRFARPPTLGFEPQNRVGEGMAHAHGFGLDLRHRK